MKNITLWLIMVMQIFTISCSEENIVATSTSQPKIGYTKIFKNVSTTDKYYPKTTYAGIIISITEDNIPIYEEKQFTYNNMEEEIVVLAYINNDNGWCTGISLDQYKDENK